MSDEECLELFREIRKVGNKLSRERDGDLESLGLTSNQSTALFYVQSHSMCQISDLAAHLETSHQAARTLVERMNAKNLLNIRMSETDGRAKSLCLSELGQKKYEEILEVGGHTASMSLSVLSTDERRVLRKLLRKISDNPRL